MSAPVQNSITPVNPTPNPEIKVVEQRVDQAGYARNRKEAVYKQAVKDHGADSAEAKAAKTELDQAQAEVDKQQGELRKLFKVSAAPRKPAPAPAAPKPKQSEIRAIFESLPAEFRTQTRLLERSVRIFSSDEELLKLPKVDAKNRATLEKLRKKIESGEIKIEEVIAPHGEVLMMKAPPRAAYLEALPEQPAPAEKK